MMFRLSKYRIINVFIHNGRRSSDVKNEATLAEDLYAARSIFSNRTAFDLVKEWNFHMAVCSPLTMA